MRRRLLALLGLLWAVPVAALPVVPGAPNSPGMDTRAAYGNSTNPTILRVTSLADSGAGTLRAALEATGNRVVIFERSGEITLNSDITVTSPYLTVAGQTAPSPGITVRHYGIVVVTHDVLLQHFRIRKGQSIGDITCGNLLELYDSSSRTYNVVVDHMSVSWGQDENVVIYNPTRAANVVIWRSISVEGLAATPGTAGCGGGGLANGHSMFVYADTTGVTIAQSLMGKSQERNPYSLGGSALVMLNNLIYGWHTAEGNIWSNADAGGGSGNPWHASVIGNRFIANSGTTEGDTTSASMFWYSGNFSPPQGNQIYRLDNTIAVPNAHIDVETNQLASIPMPYDPNVGSPPSQAPLPAGYTALASTATEANVVANAGARPADRDAVDTRIFNEIAARSSAVPFVVYPSDVGGWPTLAVNTRALTPPSNPNGDDNGNGYTNLEEWLQSYAAGVESAFPTPPGPDDVTPASGTIFVSAPFTGTAGTPLTSVTNTIGGGWALQTGSTGVLALSNANRVMGTSTALGSLTLAAGTPVSPQYDVDWDWQVLSIIPDNSYSIWLHTIPNLFTGIGVAYDTTASTGTLFYFIDGGQTVLGTCSMSLSVGSHHGTFRVRTATRHFIMDGVQCTSATDSTLPAMGQAGISAFHTTADTNTTGIHVDNFIVTDVDTLTPPSTVTKARLRFK